MTTLENDFGPVKPEEPTIVYTTTHPDVTADLVIALMEQYPLGRDGKVNAIGTEVGVELRITPDRVFTEERVRKLMAIPAFASLGIMEDPMASETDERDAA